MFAGLMPKGFPADVAGAARRTLRVPDAAVRPDDLRGPPGNRLEALSGGRLGQHGVRVNDQWRLWVEGAARAVESVDHH